MVALSFIVAIAFIFIGLIFHENKNAKDAPLATGGVASLWSWLTQTDWPTKVGAVLLIIGVGALMRYLMLFVDVPPEIKVASGAIISVLLGIAAFSLHNMPERRALHTALAGAALGTAYMTAFGAHRFFFFLSDTNAFNILAVICAFGALYAIRRKAASIAVLSLFGAFMVPTFALHGVIPVTFLSYYLALATICLGIVWQIGWRSVMHLSILFILLGGLPFMDNVVRLASILDKVGFVTALSATALFLILHLAMVLLLGKYETKTAYKSPIGTVGEVWLIGFLVAVLGISLGHDDSERAAALGALSVIWFGTAYSALRLNRTEYMHYIVMGSLYALGAVLVFMDDIPWLLWILTFFTALFWQAPRLNISRDRQDVLCVGILMTGLAYMVVATSSDWDYKSYFTLQDWLYHGICAGLILTSAWIGRERGMTLAMFLAWTGGIWLACVVIHDLVVMDLPRAVISSLGAVIGGFLVLVAEHRNSRALWSCGMALMACAAIKMVFFDFGSLGQLANILAVIATGVLFMVINWLAPYPPVAKDGIKDNAKGKIAKK